MEILDRLPARVRPFAERILAEKPAPLDQLRAEIDSYVAYLEGRGGGDDRVRALGRRCHALLDRVGDGGVVGSSPRRWVQLAIRYFVADQDADDDLDSETGLLDDAAVVAAVEAALGSDAPDDSTA